MKRQPFKKGDKLICRYNIGCEGELEMDGVYIAAHDEEPGIFETRPFIQVTVEGLDEPVAAHASRFELKETHDEP